MKTYYNHTQNRSQKSKLIEKIRGDFGTEFRNIKIDKWLLAKRIDFEPSVLYFQEENSVFERIGRTIMYIARSVIIGGNIPDKLWPKIVLIMVHVKNLRPTLTLSGKSPHKTLELESPILNHFRTLGSTVNVFIHEKERKNDTSKSVKFAPKAQKYKFVGYDGHTIYWVFFEKKLEGHQGQGFSSM